MLVYSQLPLELRMCTSKMTTSGSCHPVLSSTPQLPFKGPQVPSNRDPKALALGESAALGPVDVQWTTTLRPHICIIYIYILYIYIFIYLYYIYTHHILVYCQYGIWAKDLVEGSLALKVLGFELGRETFF